MIKWVLSLILVLISSISYAGSIGSPVPVNPIYHINLWEDFFGGNNTSGQIGQLGWVTAVAGGATTTISATAPVLNHYGLKNVSTSATLNGITSINVGNSSTTVDMNANFDLTYIIRPNTNTNMEFRVGLQASATTAPPANGVYFILDTQATSSETGAANLTTTEWGCVTRNASTSTLTDSNITVSNTTWYKLRIRKVSSSLIEFYIDDVLKCSHAADITTTDEIIGIQTENLDGVGTRDFDIDFMSLKIDGVTR